MTLFLLGNRLHRWNGTFSSMTNSLPGDRPKAPDRRVDSSRDRTHPAVHTNPKRQRGSFPFCRKDLRQSSLTLRVSMDRAASVRAEPLSIARFGTIPICSSRCGHKTTRGQKLGRHEVAHTRVRGRSIARQYRTLWISGSCRPSLAIRGEKQARVSPRPNGGARVVAH